jgi:5-formyltetrahydrofolate cyclo-ligase
MVGDRAAHLAKQQLRRRLLAERSARSEGQRRDAAAALCARVLDLPEMNAAATIAGYASSPEEPGTAPLLAVLAARGCRVLLPRLRPDFDLDWGVFEPGALQPGRFGISEPTARSLGIDAVCAASVVICPALAVDSAGHRMGRGGGSYDRVLARLPAHALRVALVYDDEVLAAVPAEAHDEPVHVVVTPSGSLRTKASQPSDAGSACPRSPLPPPTD